MRALSRLALLLLAGDRAVSEELPTYPGAVHTRIGEDLVIDGQRFELAYFLTDDSPRTVAAFFGRAWESAGYPVTLDGDAEENLVVSAFHTREGLQRSVAICRHQGRTLAFAVVKDLWSHAEASPELSLEGRWVSQTVVARDAPRRTLTQSALIANPRTAVREQQIARLKALGYQLSRDEREAGADRGWILEGQGPRGEVTVLLGEIDLQTTSLWATWTDGAR
jgi:hypothetical protein